MLAQPKLYRKKVSSKHYKLINIEVTMLEVALIERN